MKKLITLTKKAKSLKPLLMLLLLWAAGMNKGFAYHFSVTYSSGQTLYFNIISDPLYPCAVEITCPGPAGTSGWDGFTKPTGNISLPSTAMCNSIIYQVTKIGDYAFYGCSGLTGSLIIPNSVTSIGQFAFSYCTGFTSLDLGNSLTVIEQNAFTFCSGFTGSLNIPNSVREIHVGAFQHCTGFNGSLTIPNSVTVIYAAAFYWCRNFTGSLTIPNSVINIGSNAFNNCAGFTGTLTIGTGVTYLGASVFKNCTGFTQVNYNAINCADMTYQDKPFEGCTANTLTIGNSVQRIPAYMFYECCNFTGSLSIPSSVIEIAMHAFDGCSGFNNLTIGNSVTTIGSAAFQGCSGFTGSLTIPNSVTSIGNFAFSLCGFIGTLTIPNSVTAISDYTFQSCHFTGSLSIPNSVTTIGNSAFKNCQYFTGSLVIGTDVTSIDQQAFYGCTGLTSLIVYPETPPSLGYNVVGEVPTTIPVYVPCESLSAYQNASGWSVFTNYQCRETLTVYDGTDENNRIPAFIFYFDDFTRSQFVMPADDLAEMIDRPISSMTFYTTSNVSYTTVSDADVYLMEVDYTNISAYEPKENATTVYSGRLSIESTGNGGEMTIYFTTPYTYQGGNLLVGIDNTEDNGYKNIYFKGQTVSGASISGYNGSSTGTIPATQQNFIPQTTFGYAPSMCEPKSLPYTYGFEEEDEFGCWTMLRCHTTTKRDQTARHEGNYGFKFGYNSNPPQYLISPEFEGTGTMGVSFYYKNSQDIYPETFQVGYSTTTKSPNAFTWSAEVTANDQNHWMLYEDSFPAGTKYVAIKYNSYDQFYLFLDDFSFTLDCPPPSQVTFTDVSYTQATVNWVDYVDTYIALYRYDNHQFTDFETGNLSGWTSQGNATWTVGVGDGTTYNSVGTHSGSYNAKITHTSTGNEAWLISPVMNLAGVETVRADFWYTNMNWSGDIDALGLYYRVNGGEWHELWSTTEAHESWTKCSVFLENTANNYQIGFKYTDLYGYGVALDDINIVFYDVATFISTYTAHYPDQSYTFTGLDPESTYTIQMRGICDGIPNPEWTPHISFITATPTQPIFLTDGNWNDASHWSTGTLPAEGSDVVIAANATISAGYFAVVEEVTLEGGSITVADGGQLKHKTPGLEVTMKKSIVPYTNVNSMSDYYLLAFPFYDSNQEPASYVSPAPACITDDEGCDFYRYDSYYYDAEWRNHRQTPIETVEMRQGYLYANSEAVELSLTGGTLSGADEDITDRVVMINPSNFPTDDISREGWELLGNPFTYNTYVFYRNGNNDLVPMPIMIYDEAGEMQTIYGGPIAPLQGFFVHVTTSTTICFRGAAPHATDYVDLGLPSGTLWATCNVGADSPEDYGDYFAWGETTPKDTYDWSTYQYGDGDTFTKYTGSDGLTTLLPEDDAATANWGPDWHMPTEEEWQELYNNTTITWTTQNGVSGRLFTAANGNSLFLPAAGGRWDDELDDVGDYGNYWSSSLDTGLPYDAWIFGFYMDYFFDMASQVRFIGYTVRPVREN